ncbi:MAG: hypothetical protein ACYS80_05105 [Planctomycetota bacterium]|jgi:hypothetical protein
MVKGKILVGRFGAILAFVFCLGAGLWILTSVGFEHDDGEAVWTGLGLYFVGKALFVGPMLMLVVEQLNTNEASTN